MVSVDEKFAISKMEQLEKKVRRYRLSPGQYAITIALVTREQKGLCWFCHLPGVEELHHDCHDPSCRDPTHYRGAHVKCNRSEANRQRSSVSVKGEREKEKTFDESPSTGEISWESKRSLELGPALVLECDRLIAESKVGVTWKELENRLAKICGCNQQTITKFLERETTPEGRYQTSEKVVSDGRKKRTLQIVGRRG